MFCDACLTATEYVSPVTVVLDSGELVEFNACDACTRYKFADELREVGKLLWERRKGREKATTDVAPVVLTTPS